MDENYVFPELDESEELDIQESDNREPEDRLSELPDSEIHLIFSFLPMEYVVRTNILSKRWKDLWTSVSCLNFQAKIGELDKFRNFVNQALILWNGIKIQKFCVEFCSIDYFYLHVESIFCSLNLWVRFALKYKVEDLCINLYLGEGTRCWIAPLLYSCSSIRKLCLSGCDLKLHGEIHWDQLKILRIHDVNLNELLIDKVLSGSTQLEILTLSSSENLSIRSGSLKKLCIRFLYYSEDYYYDDNDDEVNSMFKIWTPNLEALEISAPLHNKCLLMNVSSLVEASLHFYHPIHITGETSSDYESQAEMLREIFHSIRHVEKLSMGEWCIKVLAVMKQIDLPSTLLNLKCLYTCIDKKELAGIMILLEISPNIAMLAIENTDHPLYEENDSRESFIPELEEYLKSQTEFPDSFLMHLRIVTIKWLAYDVSIFPSIEFVLKNASVLEKMVIRAETIESAMTATKRASKIIFPYYTKMSFE